MLKRFISIFAGLLSDMLAFTSPNFVQWGPAAAGWRWLVFVYDWDTVFVADNGTAFAYSTTSLCTGHIPCTLQVRGGSNGTLELSVNAQVQCLSSAGCSSISIRGVGLICKNNTKSAFRMEGSTLSALDVSFDRCSSDTDGGVIQAYYLAEVTIDRCNFTNVHSDGFGGAVAVYGANLSISDSRLHNCTSFSGGGAVWASAFPDCFASAQAKSTHLYISASVFSLCNTGGSAKSAPIKPAVNLARKTDLVGQVALAVLS